LLSLQKLQQQLLFLNDDHCFICMLKLLQIVELADEWVDVNAVLGISCRIKLKNNY
jgi:hypothetical protein